MKEKGIILFDGVCNLCNGSVNFVIDRDKKDAFRFAALQSQEGRKELSKLGIDTNYLDSIVLIQNNKLYHKSTAALLIAGQLSGLWPLLKVLFIVPPFIRNFFYDIIAKNRYRWFGKEDQCRVPTSELKSKFLNPQVS